MLGASLLSHGGAGRLMIPVEAYDTRVSAHHGSLGPIRC